MNLFWKAQKYNYLVIIGIIAVNCLVWINHPTILRRDGVSTIYTPGICKTQFVSETGKGSSSKQIAARMTLISESNNTQHEWPWGGKELLNLCRQQNWYKLGELPKVDVIISFIDREEMSTLIRTVHSIVQRTSQHLLNQVILVADNCLKDDFNETMDIYMSSVFGDAVKIYRSSKTLGLIQARLLGIRLATAPVVVCMDSHMEVQEFWLEPLLYEIKKNRHTLASGVLDWMEYEGNHWKYRHGGSSWKTYFDLNFVFGFQDMSKKQEQQRQSYEAFESPVIVGTIWAMDKSYFTEIGEFDTGMKLWGGENIDLPLRVWLFGGRVVNVPCSHSAHLEKRHYRDYREGWKTTIHTNYKRFVEVWFDEEYKRDFYKYFPDVKDVDVGDLSDRLLLKNKTKHNFKWFLQNVFPELAWPSIDNLAVGQIYNKYSDMCILTWGDSARLGPCDDNKAENIFFWTKDLEIRQPMYAFSLAAPPVQDNAPDVIVQKQEYMATYQMNTTSRWFHVQDGPLITSYKQQYYCLQAAMKYKLYISKNCDISLPENQWHFQNYTKDFQDIIAGKASNDAYNQMLKVYDKFKKHKSLENK